MRKTKNNMEIRGQWKECRMEMLGVARDRVVWRVMQPYVPTGQN
jgi:hypothetical protein